MVPSDAAFTAFLVTEARLLGITSGELRARIVEAGLERFVAAAISSGRLTMAEACTILNRHFHDITSFMSALGRPFLEVGLPAEEVMMLFAGVEDCAPVRAMRAPGQSVRMEVITYESSFDGLGPLYAEVCYPVDGTDLPIIVCQHGDVIGTRFANLPQIYSLAHKGFFGLAVSKRGRDGSAGASDAFGVDVHDIYDAVEHVRRHYAGLVDPTSIGIHGASGGGIDSILAAVRFPDLFRCAGPCVGPGDLDDFIRNPDWETMASTVPPAFQQMIRGTYQLFVETIGGTPDEVPDKYLARNANIAAINNPYTQIHLFTDTEEGQHPANTRSYVAYEADARAAGYQNVHLHLSGRGDPFRFLHGGDMWPEQWYLPGLRSKTYPEPMLVDTGQLVVPGFVRTKPFFIRLGSGEDTAARVVYTLYPLGGGIFRFKRLTSAPHARGRLELANPSGRPLELLVDGEQRGRLEGRTIGVDFDVDGGNVELRATLE